MKTTLRILIAGLIGLALGLAITSTMEVFGQNLFPPPPGLNPGTPEGFKAILAAMPPLAWGWLLLGYALASFLGGLSAAWLAGRRLAAALLVAALLLVFGIGNLVLLPHPTWFWFASCPVYPLFAWAGGRLVIRRRRRDEIW